MADGNPFDDPQFGAGLAPKNPFDDPNFGVPAAPRGVAGELGTALKRGTMVGLPTMVGQAMKYTSSPGNAVFDIGKSISDAAAVRGTRADLTLQPEQHNAVTNALATGVEMLPSIAAPVAATVAGVASLPVSLPSMATVALASAGMAAPFAMQAGQDTLEKGEKAGVPAETAKMAARLNAGLNFGTQFGIGLVGGQLLGRGAIQLGNLARKEAAPLAEQTLAELTGKVSAEAGAAATGVLKPFFKQLPISAAENVALGAAQMAGTAEIERRAGIDTKTPGAAAVEAIPGMLGLTAVMAPFGLAGRAVRASTLNARVEALGSEKTDPVLRDQLATQYFTELNKRDPEAAKVFAQNVEIAIQNKLPIAVDRGLFQEGAIVAPPPPEPPKLLPASIPIAAGEGMPVNPAEAAARAAADQAAVARDAARANEESRQQYVQAHEQIVGELGKAGIESAKALGFAAFRKVYAKAQGKKLSAITPAEYQEMWAKHQEDVMDANVQKGHDLAGEPVLNAEVPPLRDDTNAGVKPMTALEIALRDAAKRKAEDAAFRAAELARREGRTAQEDAIQNRAQGEALASAAEQGAVPPEAKVLPTAPANVVTALREVKPDDQKMPSKLRQEVVEATQGKASFEDQMQALRDLRDSKKSASASYELLDKLHERMNPAAPEVLPDGVRTGADWKAEYPDADLSHLKDGVRYAKASEGAPAERPRLEDLSRTVLRRLHAETMVEVSVVEADGSIAREQRPAKSALLSITKQEKAYQLLRECIG